MYTQYTDIFTVVNNNNNSNNNAITTNTLETLKVVVSFEHLHPVIFGESET